MGSKRSHTFPFPFSISKKNSHSRCLPERTAKETATTPPVEATRTVAPPTIIRTRTARPITTADPVTAPTPLLPETAPRSRYDRNELIVYRITYVSTLGCQLID